MADICCCFLQDSEIVRTWLCELRMEDCWELFDSAGYDMPTISRMTPEVCLRLFFLCSEAVLNNLLPYLHFAVVK